MRCIHSGANSMPNLEAEIVGSARREKGAMPQRIVTDEQRRNPRDIGFPFRLGHFRAATASLITHNLCSRLLVLRSLSRSKIAPANWAWNWRRYV